MTCFVGDEKFIENITSCTLGVTPEGEYYQIDFLNGSTNKPDTIWTNSESFHDIVRRVEEFRNKRGNNE